MKNLFKHIRGDAFGGITAGIVALPLALAFGVSSGLGPSAGLYGAIFLSFFAALFGGTNTQISGPTAPMTAVSMVIIAGIIGNFDGNLDKALPAILMVFILAGIIQILLGIIGLGKYIKYIPYPVVSGFMTAIGVIILITQIFPLVGYYPKEDKALVENFKPQAEEVMLDKILKEEAGEGILVLEDFKETVSRAERITSEDINLEAATLAQKDASGVVGTIRHIGRGLSVINWLELAIGLLTIFIIYGFKRITKAVPSTLVALLTVSGGAYFLGIDYLPISQIPSGFPILRLDIFTGLSLSAITPYLFTALTLALLGAIDSLLTSVVADNMTKTKHNSNKELIGQGIGNSIAALFGGIPGAGATIRTVVNINSGGKTKLSGMIAGLLLLTVLMALGPIASKIPAAVLAGILVTVGIGVMDYKGLKAVPAMPKSEVIIMITVLILSVFWNLVYAVGIGLVMAALVFMKKMGDQTAEDSDVKSLKEEVWKDEIGFPENMKEDVFIKHVKGPLFFGVTNEFQQLAKQIPPSASYIIIRLERVPYIDQSGLYAFEDVLMQLLNERKTVLLMGLNKQPNYLLRRIKVIPGLIPEKHLFDNFNECVKYIKMNVEEREIA